MMSVTIDNVNESLIEKFRLAAKEMGQEIFIRPVVEKNPNKKLPPFNQALENLPKANDDTDFFVRDYIDTDSREIDWSK